MPTGGLRPGTGFALGPCGMVEIAARRYQSSPQAPRGRGRGGPRRAAGSLVPLLSAARGGFASLAASLGRLALELDFAMQKCASQR